MQFTHDTIRMMGIHVWAVYCLVACAAQENIDPVRHQWILDHMPDKTSPNTVTAALRWLTSKERQHVLRVTGGWMLNRENAFQLPLTYNLPDGEDENRAESENLTGRGFLDHKNRAERDSCAGSSSSSSKNLVLTIEEEEEEAKIAQSAIFANLAACDETGIREPKRSEISRLEHVTPELIKAHCMQVKDQNQPIGTAIHRIQYNWPPLEKHLDPPTTYGQKIVEWFDRGDDDDDRVELHCLWQDELPEIHTYGPLKGKHKMSPFCGRPISTGKYKYCDEHLARQEGS